MLKATFIIASLYFLTTIYSIDISGFNKTLHLSDYAGKKILIVNTASLSPNAYQFNSLQQLQLLYPDKLVIITVPSNSFGNEPLEDSTIQAIADTSYSFIVAAKSSVLGAEANALYQWLSTKSQNGVFNSAIKEDFEKYLINEQGKPVGIFAGEVDPLSEELQSNIRDDQ